MLLLGLSAAVMLAPQTPSAPQTGGAKVTLARKFAAGEKLAYQVRAHITAEQRQRGLLTWIPDDFDINYNFSTVVESMKSDGIAQMLYTRPTITEIEGESFDAPQKTKVEKVDWKLALTVSPINEVISMKDLNPKVKPKPKGGSRTLINGAVAARQAPIFGEFISEVHRLSLFIGNLDSGMDFAPKLPIDEVKIGSTWKRTVGYQPQKLKGKDGQSAVQRIDYTYTYLGPMTVEGKKLVRVQAKLNLVTDFADFLRTLLNDDASKTNLKAFPLKFNAVVNYDLDPVTFHTTYAEAKSEGSWSILLTDLPDEAILEERFKGRTELQLTGRKIVKPN